MVLIRSFMPKSIDIPLQPLPRIRSKQAAWKRSELVWLASWSPQCECLIITYTIRTPLMRRSISLSMPTRIDTTKWSAALGRCLKQLERTPECDGDTLLVHQIRALIIVDKAISFHENESVYSPENTSNYSSQLYVYAMKSDLESFWSSTSEDLKASRKLLPLISLDLV